MKKLIFLLALPLLGQFDSTFRNITYYNGDATGYSGATYQDNGGINSGFVGWANVSYGTSYFSSFAVGTVNNSSLELISNNTPRVILFGADFYPFTDGGTNLGTSSFYFGTEYLNILNIKNVSGTALNTFSITTSPDQLKILGANGGSGVGTSILLQTSNTSSGSGSFNALLLGTDQTATFYNHIYPASASKNLGIQSTNEWNNLYIKEIFINQGANNIATIQGGTGNLLIGAGSTGGGGNATTIQFGTAAAGAGTSTAVTINSNHSTTFGGDILPDTNNSYVIGNNTFKWNTITTVNAVVTTSLTVNGSGGIGHTTTQPCTGTQVFTLGVLTSTTGTC